MASHLKNELLQGRWSKTMPGRDRLAKELGVDGSTIERALQQLEEQGMLQSQGPGKRRLITVKGELLRRARAGATGPESGHVVYETS